MDIKNTSKIVKSDLKHGLYIINKRSKIPYEIDENRLAKMLEENPDFNHAVTIMRADGKKGFRIVHINSILKNYTKKERVNLKLDEIEFKIWHTEEDRDDGEAQYESPGYPFWDGEKTGTLKDIVTIVDSMARHNACAEASFGDGELIYHSSDDGEIDETPEWEMLLSTPEGQREYEECLIVVQSKEEKEKQEAWYAVVKGLLANCDASDEFEDAEDALADLYKIGIDPTEAFYKLWEEFDTRKGEK